MLAVAGGLFLLFMLAIYSAVAVGRKTDQRITGYIKEDSDDPPMTVRFPEEVFRVKTSLTRG